MSGLHAAVLPPDVASPVVIQGLPQAIVDLTGDALALCFLGRQAPGGERSELGLGLAQLLLDLLLLRGSQ